MHASKDVLRLQVTRHFIQGLILRCAFKEIRVNNRMMISKTVYRQPDLFI